VWAVKRGDFMGPGFDCGGVPQAEVDGDKALLPAERGGVDCWNMREP
jgi:hypothetical protein